MSEYIVWRRSDGHINASEGWRMPRRWLENYAFQKIASYNDPGKARRRVIRERRRDAASA